MVGECRPCCLIPTMFKSVEEMHNSTWYADILEKQEKGQWPTDCNICYEQEQNNQLSMRQYSNTRHNFYKRMNTNYNILEISPSNVCNAACQTCDSFKSSYYGKISGDRRLLKLTYEEILSYIHKDVVQLEIVGGEPLFSAANLQLLNNLPKSIKYLRINTNASKYYDFSTLLEQNIVCELTLSLDATGEIFNYVRWPLKWDSVTKNVELWLKTREKYPKFKIGINAVVSALNIGHLHKLEEFASENNIGLYYNSLRDVDVLDIKYRNFLTTDVQNHSYNYNFPVAVDRDNNAELLQWLERNDRMRGINYKNYYLLNS